MKPRGLTQLPPGFPIKRLPAVARALDPEGEPTAEPTCHQGYAAPVPEQLDRFTVGRRAYDGGDHDDR